MWNLEESSKPSGHPMRAPINQFYIREYHPQCRDRIVRALMGTPIAPRGLAIVVIVADHLKHHSPYHHSIRSVAQSEHHKIFTITIAMLHSPLHDLIVTRRYGVEAAVNGKLYIHVPTRIRVLYRLYFARRCVIVMILHGS